MQFRERTEIEKGFAERFEREVKPGLLKLEDRRVARWNSVRVQIGMIAALALGIVVIGITAFEETQAKLFSVVIPIAIGATVCAAIYKSQQKQWRNSIASVLMPAVCDHVGDVSYWGNPGGRFPVSTMRDLRILGSYNRSELNHLVKGRYRDTDYSLIHAHLKHKSSGKNSSTTTIFKGILFCIGVPESAPGRILITRDIGKLGNRLGAFFSGNRGRGMPRVEFDHPRFEAAFEVHADAPGKARDFMPPAFLDILLSIGSREGGRKGVKGMSAGFRDRWFYLALSQEDEFMRMGALQTPVRDMERDIHEVFDDIGLARRIIDHLHGDKLKPELPRETGITR